MTVERVDIPQLNVTKRAGYLYLGVRWYGLVDSHQTGLQFDFPLSGGGDKIYRNPESFDVTFIGGRADLDKDEFDYKRGLWRGRDDPNTVYLVAASRSVYSFEDARLVKNFFVVLPPTPSELLSFVKPSGYYNPGLQREIDSSSAAHRGIQALTATLIGHR